MPTLFIKLSPRVAMAIKETQGATSITKAVRDLLIEIAALRIKDRSIEPYEVKSMRMDGD